MTTKTGSEKRINKHSHKFKLGGYGVISGYQHLLLFCECGVIQEYREKLSRSHLIERAEDNAEK